MYSQSAINSRFQPKKKKVWWLFLLLLFFSFFFFRVVGGGYEKQVLSGGHPGQAQIAQDKGSWQIPPASAHPHPIRPRRQSARSYLHTFGNALGLLPRGGSHPGTWEFQGG